VDAARAAKLLAEFAKWPLREVVKGTKPHHQFETRVVAE
jgi:hypothetical protein